MKNKKQIRKQIKDLEKIHCSLKTNEEFWICEGKISALKWVLKNV